MKPSKDLVSIDPILRFLKERLDQGNLLLDAEGLGSAILAEKLQCAFGGEVLDLQSIELPVTVGPDYLYVKATAVRLLRLSWQPVELVFFVEQEQLHCLLKTNLAEDWNFRQSYPDLPDYIDVTASDPAAGNLPSFFYDLEFERPMVLVFSSSDRQHQQNGQRYLNLLDPALDAVKLHPTLNYVSTLKLTSLPKIGPLLDFVGIGESSLPFYGHLNQQPDHEEIRLEMDVSLRQTYEEIFTIGLSTLVVHTSTSRYANDIGSGISLLGGITIGETSGPPQGIEVVWPIGSLQLLIQNAEPLRFPGLDTLAELVGDDYLPNEANGFPVRLNSFMTWSIRELSLALSLTPLMVHSITMSIGPEEEWTQELLGSILVIDDLLLRWQVTPGQPDPVQFDIFSIFNLAGGLINTTTSFPDFVFNGELGLQQTVDLDQVIRELLPFAPLPNLVVRDVAIQADIKQKFYTLEFDLASDWTIELAGASVLPLKRIRVSLEKDESGILASIDAVLTIAGVDLILLATNASESRAGWTFTGQTQIGHEIPIGELLDPLADAFGFSEFIVPAALESLVFQDLAVSFNTASKDFLFQGEAIFEADETEVNMALFIELLNQEAGGGTSGYRKSIYGRLQIGPLEFDLVFSDDGIVTTLVGVYTDQSGEAIDIKQDLLAALTTNRDFLDVIPDGLQVTIQDALLAYYKDTSVANPEATKFVFGLDIGGGVNLAKLPLLGELLPGDLPLKLTYQVLVASKNMTEAQVQQINQLLPIEMSPLPTDVNGMIQQGLSLSTKLMLGAVNMDLSLPVGFDEQGQLAPQPDGNFPSTDPSGFPPPVQGDSIKWVLVQKAFGPVILEKVGVELQSSTVIFWLAANLKAGALTMSLDGLGVGSPLTELKPTFYLRGLGLDYQSPAVEIGGALLRRTVTPPQGDPYDEYDGAAILKAEGLTLSAIGSYAYVDGHPSLFVYAVLDYPLGGPSFFFVTGLAAGFGYNRRLVLPNVDQVASFPLVAEAINGVPPTTGSDGARRLTQELEKIGRYIPPATGEYFFALGIKFTSFKLIDSFALVTVSIGEEVEVDLLGLSTAILPTPVAGESPVPALAEVQLALRASFRPAEGFLGVQAQLTNASYILSRACHLTGGFAFYSWFQGEHAGDFVLSLGGYRPGYQVPAHYPRVPRVGMNWRVDDRLQIKGDLYCALLPSLLMAGGNLEATWVSGNLKAWFHVGADFLLGWKPFHYQARMSLDMRAEYRVSVLGVQKTIAADLGADLRVWGPEFSGRARVHWSVISFTVAFGRDKNPQPQPIDWLVFQDSFLPAADAICGIALEDGLLARGQEQEDEAVVNPKELRLVTNSVIPVKEGFRGETVLDLRDGNTRFGIAPMGVKSEGLRTTQRISIGRDGQDVGDEFSYEPVFKDVPRGLWGEKLRPDLKTKSFIQGAVTGFTLKPKTPPSPGEEDSIPIDALQYETTRITDAYEWSQMRAFEVQDYDDDEQQREAIRESMQDPDKITARNDLLKALGIEVENTVDIRPSVVNAFVVAPQVGALLGG